MLRGHDGASWHSVGARSLPPGAAGMLVCSANLSIASMTPFPHKLGYMVFSLTCSTVRSWKFFRSAADFMASGAFAIPSASFQLQAGCALLSARRTARSVKSSVCFEPSPKLSRSPTHSEISPAGFIRTCRAAKARIRWRPYSVPARFWASVKPSVYRSKVSPSASFS
jgi:hypothetical protein